MLIEYAMIGFRSRQKNRTVAFLRQPAAMAPGRGMQCGGGQRCWGRYWRMC